MYKQNVFPRWRGFNLLGMFCSETSEYRDFRSPGYYSEEDFKMISDWGFNFVRLPLSYRLWSDVASPYKIDESKIAPLDDAVYFADKYGLHVNIAMHRLPGYCVNQDEKVEERGNLWTDSDMLDASSYQWTQIAKRYKDVGDGLSFNVINEPDRKITPLQYRTVSEKIITDVRKISPRRLFILDGICYGDIPPVDAMRYFENCGYSCRGYEPRRLTHYFGGENEEIPKWPDMRRFDNNGDFTLRNKEDLEQFFSTWASLSENLRVGVHCGEMAVYHKCPHGVAMSWLEDTLSVLKSYNIGWAFWNLRGKFGIMDNGRSDIEMTDYHGHKLDTEMLKLLQKY